jgi:hypothetical protein
MSFGVYDVCLEWDKAEQKSDSMIEPTMLSRLSSVFSYRLAALAGLGWAESIG